MLQESGMAAGIPASGSRDSDPEVAGPRCCPA